MNLVPTRHGPMHYLEVGAGAPLVLLHGNTYSAHSQERLAARFADEHRVLSVDLLGHGKSARPDGLFTTSYFTMQGEALADLLGALFEAPVPLFGMSAGGVTALNAVCHRPDLVSALILDGVFDRVAAGTVTAHNQATKAMSPTWHRYMGTQHGEDWWPTLNAGVEHAIELLGASGDLVAPCLEAIAVPSLVFQGGADGFVSNAQAGAVVSGIKQAKMVYLADAGHLIAWHNPQMFRERARQFLHEHGLV